MMTTTRGEVSVWPNAFWHMHFFTFDGACAVLGLGVDSEVNGVYAECAHNKHPRVGRINGTSLIELMHSAAILFDDGAENSTTCGFLHWGPSLPWFDLVLANNLRLGKFNRIRFFFD